MVDVEQPEVADFPQEIDAPVVSEEMYAKVKEEVLRDLSLIKKERPPYRMPLTKFAKADLVHKVITVGYGMGFMLEKDICIAMGLQKGQMVRVSIELFPDDAAKLFSS